MNKRWRPFARAALLVVMAGWLVGCGGHYVNRGADLFSDGRYVEAAEVFERTEHRLKQSDPGEKARYGLYRGATLFVLGDFAHAQSWLAYAREIERANPGSLDSEEHAFLARVSIALDARYRGLPDDSGVQLATAPPAPAPPSTQAAPPPASPSPATGKSLVAPQ